MTNDIEILNRLEKIEQDLLEIKQLIGRDTGTAKSKQLVEDVICPGPFPEGVCGQCKFPKNKCICEM